MRTRASLILHTIGHSNRSIGDLLRALKGHGISYIVDVRSSPRSHRFPHFNRPELRDALKQAGIGYVYMGDKLGGKSSPDETKRQWKQGKVDPHLVSHLSRSDDWLEGIRRLASLVTERAERGESGCLLCSEGDANSCHRLLIAFDVLNSLPELTVNHILPEAKRSEEIHFQKTLL
jgi:uncharacterized protein (DUF488 family)